MDSICIAGSTDFRKDASGVGCIDKPVHGEGAEKAHVARPPEPADSGKSVAIAVSVDATVTEFLQDEEAARIRTEEVAAWRHQLNALSEQESEEMERDWEEAVRDDWEEERERKDNEMIQDDLRCEEAQFPHYRHYSRLHARERIRLNVGQESLGLNGHKDCNAGDLLRCFGESRRGGAAGGGRKSSESAQRQV